MILLSFFETGVHTFPINQPFLKGIEMRLRSRLFEWFILVLVNCIIGGIGFALLLYLIPAVFWMLSISPLRWFPPETVFKMSILGGGIGCFIGTSVYLINVRGQEQHSIQEPKRQRWQLSRCRPGLRRAMLFIGVAAAVTALSWLAYTVFFYRKSLSDVIMVGLAVLALGIVFGTMIWPRPPKD